MKNKITKITLFILISLLLVGCNLLGDTDLEIGSDVYKIGFMLEGCDNRAGETIRVRLTYLLANADLITNFSYTIPDPYYEHSLIFYLSQNDNFYNFRGIVENSNSINSIIIWWDANNNGALDSSGLGESELNYMVSITNNIIDTGSFATNNGVVLFNARNLFGDNY